MDIDVIRAELDSLMEKLHKSSKRFQTREAQLTAQYTDVGTRRIRMRDDQSLNDASGATTVLSRIVTAYASYLQVVLADDARQRTLQVERDEKFNREFQAEYVEPYRAQNASHEERERND